MIDLKQTFKVELDKANHTFYATFLKLLTDNESNIQQAKAVVKEVIEGAGQEPGQKFKILVDLMPLGKGAYIANQTRKLYLQAMQHPQARKIAIVGTSRVYRIIVNFIALAAGRTDVVKWFDDKQKALAWLNT